MDSPAGDRRRRDRDGERAVQAQLAPRVRKRAALAAMITPEQLEEFKRRVAPLKPTQAITAMVLKFLGVDE